MRYVRVLNQIEYDDCITAASNATTSTLKMKQLLLAMI